MPTGNLIMAGNPEPITHVYTVEENIAKVKTTVLRGDVFGEHVARGTISQANVKRKKKLTDLKKVIRAMRNFFII